MLRNREQLSFVISMIGIVSVAILRNIQQGWTLTAAQRSDAAQRGYSSG